MRPFYDHDGIALWHAPQEAILPLLPTRSIAAVITDMPYGTTQLDWDIRPDLARFWSSVKRLCRPEALQVCFSAQPFATDLIISNRDNYRYELIWPKPLATKFLDSGWRPLEGHETIQVFGRAPKSATYNPQKQRTGIASNTVRQSSAPTHHYGAFVKTPYVATDERHPTTVLPPFSKGLQADSDHETAKPLDLMLWLIATYTNPGDTVLDPFVGCGTTALACKRLGRRCIGIEIRTEPLAIAARKLAQDVMVLA